MTGRLQGGRCIAPAVVLLIAVAAGCGDRNDRFTLVPAEGVLKIDGRPAANITIQFMPDVARGGRGPTSFATTDAEGKFQLKTYDGRDGAVEGAHIVILADQDEERPAQGQPLRKTPRLDSKYSTAAGGLTAEVKKGTPITLDVPRS
jgi:hypothetical protein